MSALDLNVAQFGLLAAVAKMPGASLSAIGEAMLIEESAMARNFAVLERRGLVEAQGGRGRGGKQVSLTKEGVALHAKGSKIWLATNKMLAAELSPAKAAAGREFMRGLAETAEKLRQKEPAGG